MKQTCMTGVGYSHFSTKTCFDHFGNCSFILDLITPSTNLTQKLFTKSAKLLSYYPVKVESD
jgi:hypothetical protein